MMHFGGYIQKVGWAAVVVFRGSWCMGRKRVPTDLKVDPSKKFLPASERPRPPPAHPLSWSSACCGFPKERLAGGGAAGRGPECQQCPAPTPKMDGVLGRALGPESELQLETQTCHLQLCGLRQPQSLSSSSVKWV